MPIPTETITHIELSKLIPFKDHPFAVRDELHELAVHKPIFEGLRDIAEIGDVKS